MKTSQAAPGSVDDYIAEFPRPVRAALRKVRRAIRKGVPGADEAISYRIPAFKVDGRVAIYFAGWKAHYSIYPSTAPLVAAFRKELAPYDVNDKGTIRFPLDAPVPLTLIEGLARFRAKETVAGGRTKAAAPKAR